MDREKILLEIAPLLYWEHCWLDCGPGWDSIIQCLSRRLERLIVAGVDEHFWDANNHPYAIQIKEKFGTLRFYISQGTDEMYDLIEEAEAESSQTCEQCGCRGKMRCERGWYAVRCDTCWNKTQEEKCSHS